MWNKAEVGAVNSIILKRRNPPIVPHDGVQGLCNTVAKRQFSSFKCIRDKLVFLSRLRFFRVALLLKKCSNLKSRKRTYGWFYLVFISFKLRFFIRALLHLLLLKYEYNLVKKDHHCTSASDLSASDSCGSSSVGSSVFFFRATSSSTNKYNSDAQFLSALPLDSPLQQK